MSFLNQLSKAYGLPCVQTRALCCRYLGPSDDDRVVHTLDEALAYLEEHGSECVFTCEDGKQVIVQWMSGERLRLRYGPDYPIDELNKWSYQWYVANVVLPDFIDPTPLYLSPFEE